jgi:hypothetical protein
MDLMLVIIGFFARIFPEKNQAYRLNQLEKIQQLHYNSTNLFALHIFYSTT